MEDVKRILAVSRSTRQCPRVVSYAASLARKHDAELCVVRVVHDPFSVAGWNLPMPSLDQEYKQVAQEAQTELDRVVAAEKTRGLSVREFVLEGKPVEELIRLVRDENIDVMILLAHEEGRIEHFLFGRTNEELFRRMPCSLFFLKSDPALDTA